MHSLLKRLLPITLERCNDSERCYSMWASVARSLAWQSGTVDATPLPIMQVPRSLLQRTAIGINLGVIRTPRRTHLTMMGSRQERAAQGCSSQLVATGAMLVRRHPPPLQHLRCFELFTSACTVVRRTFGCAVRMVQ